MRISLEITGSSKAVPPAALQPVASNGWWGNWFGTILESFSGAWQRNVEVRLENVLSFSTVYACVTLITSDIGKMHLRYIEKDDDDVWSERENAAFSPLLRKPNRYQTRQKFVESWMTSKLIHGNTYALKERDSRNVVVASYVLDPLLTKPMVAPDGSVWYSLSTSKLAGIESENGSLLVPASEIFHDINVALYHPLCGVSPITACGLAALQGVRINENSVKFFENGSRPGGILTARANSRRDREAHQGSLGQ